MTVTVTILSHVIAFNLGSYSYKDMSGALITLSIGSTALVVFAQLNDRLRFCCICADDIWGRSIESSDEIHAGYREAQLDAALSFAGRC